MYNDSHLLFVRADLLPPMLVKVSNLLAINDNFIRIVFILSVKLIRLSDNTVKVYDGQHFSIGLCVNISAKEWPKSA